MKKLDELENSVGKSSNSGDLKCFLLGLILLVVGIFMVFTQTSVSTAAYVWHIGSFGVPTGIVAIPMFIGVIMLFFNNKSVVSWIIFIAGLAFLIITIILSVNIRFRTTSLLTYVFMFGSILAGTGLLLRGLFPKKKG